ncbi:uncharacterized protein LOC132176367 isoform X1 [Corylus avellana]|uniref:uncharacterized protein LOC132176367 isoform X1 n=1 Tax=Corylus avellana TaxID=13451 RepID=UPI001E2328EE|nr:uncharacterized protein LOC132176367 isoform X1 [Corylus avellana]XP_059444535.1 uncharacterized protein LOC132176367 isoform X1 [Corylus avellana]XP_059444536.1 uncharacterized protein LOC132176367 isoform X1 [Corylus avellana]
MLKDTGGDGDVPDLENQSANANANANNGDQTPGPSAKLSTALDTAKEEQLSPKKPYLSRTASSVELCRVCQQEKEEVLIELGCHCRGGLAKAHRSCIDTWFCTRGSNKCEICQQIAANVPPPVLQTSQTNYWVWRIDPNFRHQDRESGCISPLWVAFSILIGGLLLDVLISITLGISALPVNIIIGVIIVLGLGTALRLVVDVFHEWSLRRVVVQRVEANVNLGYHPAL